MIRGKPYGILESDRSWISGGILFGVIASIATALVSLWILPLTLALTLLVFIVYSRSHRRIELYEDSFCVISRKQVRELIFHPYAEIREIVFESGIRGSKVYTFHFNDFRIKPIRILYQSFEPKRELEFLKKKGVLLNFHN